jgi:hypothetical protein
MIDTITIRQAYKEQDKQKLNNFFNSKLILKSDTKYLKGYRGKSLIGSYANWEFYLGDVNFKIVGSLTTASKTNNLYNSTYEDIKQALDELQQLFCLNLDNATVLRVDVAYNFILNQPIFNYHNFLICPEKFKQVEHKNETLQFNGKGIVITFYDKIKERAKNKNLPRLFKSLNMMRFEVKIRTEGFKSIGLSRLKFAELYEETTFLIFVNAWFDQYLKIERQKEYVLPEIESISLSGFKDFAVRHLLNTSIGQNFTKSFLADKSVTPKQRHDINKYINSINIGKPIHNPLEDELSNKVRLAYCKA